MASKQLTKVCETCGKIFKYYRNGHHVRVVCSMRCRDPKTAEERFYDMTDRSSGECWKWMGFIGPDGYGRIRVNGRNVRAPRFAYMMAHGAIPPGLVVRHRCHNPACVNPAHLLIGTNADNSADMTRAQRQARGESNGSAKLTSDQVIAIRGDHRSLRVLALKYGVGRSTIRRARTQSHWKHVGQLIRNTDDR